MPDIKTLRWDQLYIGATIWNPEIGAWDVLVDTRDGWWLAHTIDGNKHSITPKPPDLGVHVSESTEPEAQRLVESMLGGERLDLYDAAELRRVREAVTAGKFSFTSIAMPRKGPGAGDAVASHLKIMHGIWTEDVKPNPGTSRISSLLEAHDLSHADGPSPSVVPHRHKEGTR